METLKEFLKTGRPLRIAALGSGSAFNVRLYVYVTLFFFFKHLKK